MITPDDLLTALPAKFRSAATQNLADTLNKISSDPLVAQSIQENFITYASVLQQGKFKLEDYLNAVKYVSFKHMGLTNKKAYQNTFPKRYTKLIADGRNDKEISAYVAAFSKTKLVTALMEQSLIPMWLLHSDAYNKAVETQVELMMTANSEKVRSDAANSVLTHLKRPESSTVDINIGVHESDTMKELRDMMGSMAQRQQELIKQGVSTREIAEHKYGGVLEHNQSKAKQIIDVTPVDVSEGKGTK